MSSNISAGTIWHYTTGDKLAMILTDREIRTTSAFIEKGEKPAAWFSSNPNYEFSAAKGIYYPDGRSRTASIEEMQEQAGGVWRIGIRRDAPGLMRWKAFKRTSGISSRAAKALEAVGRRTGGDPREWYASYAGVPVEQWVEIAFLEGDTWMAVLVDDEALAMFDEHFGVKRPWLQLHRRRKAA